MDHQTQTPPKLLPATWLGRLIAVLVASALAVVGLFFVAFALIAAVIVVAIVVARIWWVSRKMRTARNKDVIEGSYSVEIERDPLPPPGKS